MAKFQILTLLLPLLFFFGGIQAWTGNIVFEDEFEGDTLDLNKWRYESGCSGYGSNNQECYVSGTNNVQVQNGHLIITAKIEEQEDKHFTSGRIVQNGPGFVYGAYVTRARLPLGKHLWPAFWMLFATECKFEEIDIMEYRGQVPQDVEMSAHYGHDYAHLVSKGELKTNPADLSADFHEFAVLWLPDRIEYYVDNVKYSEQNLDPSLWREEGTAQIPCGDNIQPFTEMNNFVINLAVGGNFFDGYGGPVVTVEEARQWPKNTYEVDWVRIYQE